MNARWASAAGHASASQGGGEGFTRVDTEGGAVGASSLWRAKCVRVPFVAAALALSRRMATMPSKSELRRNLKQLHERLDENPMDLDARMRVARTFRLLSKGGDAVKHYAADFCRWSSKRFG